MSARVTATLLAVTAFVMIVGLALLGADRPPPPGFLVVVALAAGYAAGIRMLVPRLLRLTTGRSLVLAGLWAAAWCLLGWTLTLPFTPWSPWLLVGLLVVCVLGATGGVLIMAFARLICAEGK